MMNRVPRAHWLANRATAVSMGVALSLSVAVPTTWGQPVVPDNLQVPDGQTVFLVGHAVGTQNYVCVPSGGALKFVLVTPRATLFGDQDEQVTTHYFSANPSDDGAIRATWQDSRDTSTVWGAVVESSSDPSFVVPGAIAWLLIQAIGVQDGPTGGNTLSGTTYIQRLNTSGGVAPSTGCATSTDVGNQAFVSYTADYYFYRAAD